MKYEMTLRNKWITADAKSPIDMLLAYESSIKEIKNMIDDGLEFDFQCAGDDYINIFTENKELADKYSMNEMHLDEDIQPECDICGDGQEDEDGLNACNLECMCDCHDEEEIDSDDLSNIDGSNIL